MSEPVWMWTLAILVVAAVVVPYYVAFRRRGARDRARKEEAARLGLDRPVAQFPYVDAGRCIGCGACVDACPEGDVLGVVGGTATVVNGLRCIGHAACGEACPVGAIEVGLGDLRSRTDVPILDVHHQTSLPGVYVVGELGGLALIRNAVEQGRLLGEHLATLPRRRRSDDEPDLLVVGAGPAGLTAALTALERGLRPRVLEQEPDLGGTILHYPRRKLVLVQEVDLPYGERLKGGEHAKEDLLERLEYLLSRARVDVRFGERAAGISQEDGVVAVRTASGEHRAGAVVLALGRRGTPRKLGVPGEDLPKVMYRLIDAESYRDQRLLVVGGGDSAIEAVIGLARQSGNEVTLSYRREKLVRIKKKNEDRLAQLVASRRVRLALPSQVAQIDPDRVRLTGPEGAREIANDYVFVFAGGEPPFALLREAGIRFGGDQLGP